MTERCPNCREKVFFSGSICPNCGADRDQPVVGKARPIAAAATSHPAALWAALALIVLAIGSFMWDWMVVSTTGSLDYRNRVVGLRLLTDGMDPYHYKWQRGGPETLCDVYENHNLPITKTTVTPAMLLTGWPLELLPYPVSQMLWLLTEWALLAALWWVWFTWPGQTLRSRWWWSVLVVAFSFTLGWRKHIDNGQAYLLWAVLLSLWQRLSLAGTRPGLTGLLAGLLLCLRPPLLLVIGPFLLFRRRGQWLGAAVGVVLGLGTPVLLRPGVWQEYGQAMDTWSELHRTYSNPRPGVMPVPATIEGMPVERISAFRLSRAADSSLYAVFRLMKLPPMPALPVLGILALACAGWWWWARKSGDAAILGGLAGWVYLTDFFLPAYRYPYDDVMILVALALIPLVRRMEKATLTVAVVSIATGIVVACWKPPTQGWVYVPTYAMIALALLMLIRSHRPCPAVNLNP